MAMGQQTHPIETGDFNITIAGDFGCTPEARKTFRAIEDKQPELVIGLGDLAYKKNPACWFEMISPLETNNKFKIAFGEHDVSRGNQTYAQYIKHFNLTKPYYSFDYGNIHFLAMATAKNKIIPYNLTSEQYQFIKKDLEDVDKNQKIKWIIVYSFRSFYSSNTTHPGLDELQDAYHPLFDKHNVDVVFQGHNHNYQRTFPLSYNTTKQYTPIITDKHTMHYQNLEHGQLFLTAGTGGADFYNFTGKAPYVVEQLLQHGFVNIESMHNGSELRITFFDNNGIARDGVSISKN
jgi:predicted phosphodiesterase